MNDHEPTASEGVQVVCIVGMHRSGTSCLAGSLEEAGLYLGDVITEAPNNRKGTRENMRITALHDAVLLHSGGSWMQPPEQVSWSASHRAEREAITGAYSGKGMWGFKDPRTVLLLDFWQEKPSNMRFVGTLRHPRRVAESLFRRNGGTIEQWIDLWVDYNKRMLMLHRASPFPIVNFDFGESVYRKSVSTIAAELSLDAAADLQFFDRELRHHNTLPVGVLPSRVSSLYEALCEIAHDPER